MKIKEFTSGYTGIGGSMGGHESVRMSRVRELQKGEKVPDGATEVSDDTPVSDWSPVEDKE